MPHSIKIRGFGPPELQTLPQDLRQQFWQLVAPIALKVKDQELAAGLDADGDPLKSISPRTRRYRRSAMVPGGKGDPSAPPLMPAYQKSRVRSLLAARAFPTHCELYWRYDPFSGASFDQILTYQQEQGRDVFGISPDGLARIKQQSLAAWTKWRKAGLAPTEKRSAFPAAALTAGPQPRIAGIVARSAEPGAAAGFRGLAGIGTTETRFITRGIGAPFVKDLKASQTRTGGLTREQWQRYLTAEVPPAAGGRAAPKPAAPRAPKPAAPRAVAALEPKTAAKPPETEQPAQAIPQLAPIVFARAAGLVNPVTGRGFIDELRAAAGLDPQTFDRVFQLLLEQGKLVAYQADAPVDVREHGAGVWYTPSGSPRHIFYIQRR